MSTVYYVQYSYNQQQFNQTFKCISQVAANAANAPCPQIL